MPCFNFVTTYSSGQNVFYFRPDVANRFDREVKTVDVTLAYLGVFLHRFAEAAQARVLSCDCCCLHSTQEKKICSHAVRSITLSSNEK